MKSYDIMTNHDESNGCIKPIRLFKNGPYNLKVIGGTVKEAVTALLGCDLLIKYNLIYDLLPNNVKDNLIQYTNNRGYHLKEGVTNEDIISSL